MSDRLKPNTTYRLKIERPQYVGWKLAIFTQRTWGGGNLEVVQSGGWRNNGSIVLNITTDSVVYQEDDFNYIIVGSKAKTPEYGFADWEDPTHPLPDA